MSLSSCNAQGQVHALRNESNLYAHHGFSMDACTCVSKHGQMILMFPYAISSISTPCVQKMERLKKETEDVSTVSL